MFNKYQARFERLIRNDSLDKGVVEVNSQHISTKGFKFRRGEIITLTDRLKHNVFVTVKGNNSIKKNTISMSYETAVDLALPNIRASFNKNNSEKIITVDLLAKKLNSITYIIESVKTGNSVSRWLAVIGIFSAIDLITNTLINFFSLLDFLKSWVDLNL